MAKWYGILQLLLGSRLDNFPLKTLKLDWVTFHSVTFQLKCLAFQSNQSSQSSHVLAMGYWLVDDKNCWTGLNNVCACARSHGSRCRQRPAHHNKPRKNGGVFKSFVWCPVYDEKGEPDWKREKEIFTLVPSTIGRHIPFCTLELKACKIGENSA